MRSTSCLQDSFERTKYFGPVNAPGVALAILDEARADGASCSMSVARADGVSKRTGRWGRPLTMVPSAGAGARVREVRAACAATNHLWRYLHCSSRILCTCSSSIWLTSASTPMALIRVVGLRSRSTENVLSGDRRPGRGVGKFRRASATSSEVWPSTSMRLTCSGEGEDVTEMGE